MAPETILLRAYSPLGFYPSEAFVHPEGCLVLDDDLIFSVVREYEVDIDGYFIGRQWLNPAEVRLLSSLMLSVQHQHGKIYAYPDVLLVRVEDGQDYELTDAGNLELLKGKLIDGISSRNESNHNPLFYKPIPQAPYFGGSDYRYNENADDTDHQLKAFAEIDVNDYLLIRGLGALIKGEPLNVHHIFHTEACISLYIAMEASMHIIFRRLRSRGRDPKPRDASQYLAAAFNSRRVPDRYFGEFYDDRIRTVHPDSRFGTFPVAPLMADDYFDLYDHLRSVYDFLITNRVDPSYEGR